MSGIDFLEVLLMLVLWHIPLAVTCLHVYEQQQSMWPGSRIQYSLVDLFLLTVAAALTISIWSNYTTAPNSEPSARDFVALIIILSHQFAGVLIMRLQPRGYWKKYEFVQSAMDVLTGSMIGLMVMTLVSAIGVVLLVFWFPIWLFFRFRKWREKMAATREELGA